MNLDLSKIKNLLAQSFAAINEFHTDVENLAIARGLWEKLLKNSEATVLLLEANFYHEAVSIQRLSLEHYFNIFALVKSQDFLISFKTKSDVELKKAMDGLNRDNNGDNNVLTPQKKILLTEAIERYEQDSPSSNHDFFNAAKIGGIKETYNSVYRLLSMTDAHSTYLSVISEHSLYPQTELIDNFEFNLTTTMILFKNIDEYKNTYKKG